MCRTEATPEPALFASTQDQRTALAFKKVEAMELTRWQKLKNHPDPVRL